MKELTVDIAWECISRSTSVSISLPDDVYTTLKYDEGEKHMKAWNYMIDVLEDYVTDVVMLENGVEITYLWFVIGLKF